jgi:hypothetical protein
MQIDVTAKALVAWDYNPSAIAAHSDEPALAHRRRGPRVREEPRGCLVNFRN